MKKILNGWKFIVKCELGPFVTRVWKKFERIFENLKKVSFIFLNTFTAEKVLIFKYFVQYWQFLTSKWYLTIKILLFDNHRLLDLPFGTLFYITLWTCMVFTTSFTPFRLSRVTGTPKIGVPITPYMKIFK